MHLFLLGDFNGITPLQHNSSFMDLFKVYFLHRTRVNHHQTTIWENICLLSPSKSKVVKKVLGVWQHQTVLNQYWVANPYPIKVICGCLTLRSHPHTPGRYRECFTSSLWRISFLCGVLGKFGVSSQGMWAKSLTYALGFHKTNTVRVGRFVVLIACISFGAVLWKRHWPKALAIPSFEDMGAQNDHSEDDWIPVIFWFLVFDAIWIYLKRNVFSPKRCVQEAVVWSDFFQHPWAHLD